MQDSMIVDHIGLTRLQLERHLHLRRPDEIGISASCRIVSVQACDITRRYLIRPVVENDARELAVRPSLDEIPVVLED